MIINAIKTLCNLPLLYQTATIEDEGYLVETIFYGMLIYNEDNIEPQNLNTITEDFLALIQKRRRKIPQKNQPLKRLV